MRTEKLLPLVFSIVFLASLAACNDGGGGAPPPAPTYSIGGTVTGLLGTVVLQNNGANNLSLSADGSFTFSTKIANGAAYAVTVSTQPGGGQTCTASSNTGSISGANITTVSVICSTVTYTVGGTVANLTGAGLVLQNNGADNHPISANGNFTFNTPVASGAGYAVTIFAQPAAQRCTVSVGSGTATATANVTGVAINCVPLRLAYVANYASHDISAYAIDAIGALVQVNCGGGDSCNGANFLAGTNPNAVAVTPLGKFAYVANNFSNNISAYTISASSGALVSVGTAVAGNRPASIAIDPSGKFLYAANFSGNDVSAYTIHPTTGALTSIELSVAAGLSPISITVHPSGKFAYVANSGGGSVSSYTINTTTGALAAIGTVSAGSGAQAITVDPTGKFAYVANANAKTISAYTVNATSGALTPITCAVNCVGGNFVAGTGPTAITVDPAGKFVYAANYNTNDISAYTINNATGALSVIDCGSGVATACNGVNFQAGIQPASITVDRTGQSVYVANNGGGISAYLLDSSTGLLSAIAGSPFTAGTSPASVTTAAQ